ncbi:MAG: ABC transporter substrate-binding protein [Planctomycetota bacterium]
MRNLIAFLCALFVLSAACLAQEPAAASRELVAGVILPETGEFASWGKEMHRGLELAVKHENSRRAVQLRLVFADTASTPDGTLQALNQVLKQGICVLVGPVTTKNARAVADRVRNTPLPWVLPIVTGDKLLAENPSLYRVCFDNTYQAAAMALFAFEDLKAKRAGLLYDETDEYSSEIAKAFTEAFEASGGSFVGIFGSVRSDRTDCAKELASLAAADAQVVALPLMADRAAAVLKQAFALKSKFTFIGSDGWEDARLFDVGEAASGHYFATHFAADEGYPPTRAFVEKYRKAFPDAPRPASDAALGYDAGLALADAASRAGGVGRPEDVAIALSSIENLPGVTGLITIGPDRRADKGVVIVRTGPKGATFVKRYPPTGVYLDETEIPGP